MRQPESEVELQTEKGVMLMAEEHAISVGKFPERVAAVVGKTFLVMGADAFTKGLTDDEAIALIKDLLQEVDPSLIERNKNKSLSRLKRAS